VTDRLIETEKDRQLLLRFIEAQKLPFCIHIQSGRKRSIEQNKLQRMWCNEISEQVADRSPEEVRGELKLNFGVPILLAENEAFWEAWEGSVRHLPYATQLSLMMVPLDLPITRIMTSKQKTAYLDAISRFAAQQGWKLTHPGEPSEAAA
jgi:hypothetical protein